MADDDGVENSSEANELHAANGQSSNNSFSHSQLEQTDDELQQLLSLQQLGFDEIQCSLQFANNCIETGEAVELCQEFFEEVQQKIVDFEFLTKQIILHSKSHLNRQSAVLQVSSSLRFIFSSVFIINRFYRYFRTGPDNFFHFVGFDALGARITSECISCNNIQLLKILNEHFIPEIFEYATDVPPEGGRPRKLIFPHRCHRSSTDGQWWVTMGCLSIRVV